MPPRAQPNAPDWWAVEAFWPLAEYSEFYRDGPLLWHVQRFGKGPLAVLLHGTGASCHSMAALAQELSSSHHVLLLDLPGHGFTQTANGFDPTLDEVSLAIERALSGLNLLPDLIIGHSAGAAISLKLAQLISDDRIGVVSINGALKPFEGIMGLIAPVTAKLFTFGGFAAGALARNAGNIGRVRELIEGTGSVISESGLKQYHYLMRNRAHIQGTLKLMANWDLTEIPHICHQLSNPTLFLVGDRDRAVSPTGSREICRIMSDGNFQSLHGLGHLVHEEDPKTVAEQIINWHG